MVEETRRILRLNELGEGIVFLSNLAVKWSMSVYVDGVRVIPVRFDIYGRPIFSKEQVEEFYKPIAEVKYDKMELSFTRDEIDSVEGIRRNYINNRYAVETLLLNRRLYVASKKKLLNEFVLFSNTILDKYGRALPIKNNPNTLFVDVEEYIKFIKRNSVN